MPGPIQVCKACGQVIKCQRMTIKEILEERLQVISDYADEHPEFDRAWLDSVCEQILAGREMSPAQVASMNNIIEKFRME